MTRPDPTQPNPTQPNPTKRNRADHCHSQLRIRELSHSLPDAEIAKDLLGAAEDGVELVRAVEHLYDLAHARLGEPAAAEDLDRLVGDLVRRSRDAHLEQADRPAEVLRLLLVGHVAHLVGDGLEPGLVRLGEGDHLGESVFVWGFVLVGDFEVIGGEERGVLKGG